MATLDHLVYATPDVDATVAELGATTGAYAAPGGSHAGHGTRNALLSLGPRCYLEIIGPDREQPEPAGPRPFGVDEVRAAALLTWAVGVDDIDVAVAGARKLGYEPGDPISMQRRRPDGVLLSWRLTPPGLADGGIVPFFIEWVDSPHPAESAPPITLVDFTLTHPRPSDVRYPLLAVGAEVPLRTDDRRGLHAVIEGPAGRVAL